MQSVQSCCRSELGATSHETAKVPIQGFVLMSYYV